MESIHWSRATLKSDEPKGDLPDRRQDSLAADRCSPWQGTDIGDALCPKVMPGAEEELRDVSFLLKKS